ncbi:MAG: PEP-CTERM sorting domain-containing protein [Planctomycetia bacterium]|nr:PEP-CTERM sorting domain-containing protein [Planctomycetia bacterium]
MNFTRSGSDLIVTLANKSSADATVPTDILTGVFFKLDGDPALTRTSALVAKNSVFVSNTGVDVTPADLVVGGEWAYKSGLSPAFDANQGISSAGLGIFGPPDLFPGSNLQDTTSPGGIEYGITRAGDNLLTGNGGLSGQHLIKNSVTFTLSGFSGEPDAKITKVFFQYGTALDEPRDPGTPDPLIPEPSTFCLGALALAGMTLLRRRLSR